MRSGKKDPPGPAYIFPEERRLRTPAPPQSASPFASCCISCVLKGRPQSSETPNAEWRKRHFRRICHPARLKVQSSATRGAWSKGRDDTGVTDSRSTVHQLGLLGPDPTLHRSLLWMMKGKCNLVKRDLAQDHSWEKICIAVSCSTAHSPTSAALNAAVDHLHWLFI